MVFYKNKANKVKLIYIIHKCNHRCKKSTHSFELIDTLPKLVFLSYYVLLKMCESLIFIFNCVV